MRQVELGTTGLQISELIFGGASIGGVGSAAATRELGMNTDEALERLDEAYEVGTRVIDTANSFGGGQSERVIGRWREERERADVLVSTKVGNVVERGQDGISLSADHIERQFALSRSRLGTVDLYLAHAADESTPLEETITAFAALLDSGSIKAYGFSNVDARRLEQLLTAADRAGLPRPGWVQNQFSLVARADGQDLLAFAAAEGVGYVGYSPLAGGLLSDRYLDIEQPPPDGSRLAIAPGLYSAVFTEQNRLRVAELEPIARELELSIAGLALAWLRWHPLVSASIVSPRRTSQWDAVTQALALDLEDETAERVGALFG